MNKKVIILIDAFRWDYISKVYTPFLYFLSNNSYYIKQIIPAPGFCERTELFAGLGPFDSKMFLAYSFKSKTSKTLNLNFLQYLESLKISDYKFFLFGKKITVKKLIRVLASKILKRNFQLIPFDFIDFFELSEDKYSMDDKRFPLDNLIKDLNRLGIKYSMTTFTGLNYESSTDNERIELFKKEIKDKSLRYQFLYLGEIDFLGHKYGPKSLKKSEELLNFDKKIKGIITSIKSISKNIEIQLIGDHGMSEIQSTFDIEAEINSFFNLYKLKRVKDYIYFIDSNYLRVWFFSDTKTNKLKFKEYFKDKKDGSFLSDQDLKSLNSGRRKYGDVLWCANEGVLLFPNFFNYSILKGMHGYLKSSSDSNGFYIKEKEGIENIKIKKSSLKKIFH